MSYHFVSVIVPVLNDSERLRNCLKALEDQTYTKNLYEIIVVDNGSQDNIESVVSQYRKATLYFESKPGSYSARNKGLSIAKGDIIAFTDSDCIPAQDWIENGVANILRASNCGLLAGKINIFFRNPDKPTSVELYESVMAFQQKHYAEVEGYGATANMFTFRRVIDHIGGFNDVLNSAGDFEWGQRAISSGYKTFYGEDACVSHPARYSLDELYKKHTRVIKGYYDFIRLKKPYPLVSLIGSVAIELLPPVVFISRICSNERFKRLKGRKEKSQVISVLLFIRYFRALEKIRLLLGLR
ncbi:MAG: glycosyltransferase family 2 protein [Candidatus Dadabacteria bacterium]|nr:glycosyltransferase family 2 protein [Candidatus Dadabacteria bacterium]